VIQETLLGVLNHLLGQAAWARRHLQAFTGRTARFVMPPWQLAFGISADGLFQNAADVADVTVSLPAGAPLLLLRGVDGLMAEAHVTGNAEFATALSFVLRNLHWDAEEDLSRVFGDIAAIRLVRFGRSLTTWPRQAGDKLVENLADFMGQEGRWLTPAPELAVFRTELAELDDRLARLKARIAAL
jgi:ubiquinone biosynthesis protein UbiJ